MEATRGFTAGLELVPVALAALRARVLDLAGGLDAQDWEQRSRCERWTVHDVLRHVRDGCRIHVGRLRGELPMSVLEGFDARETPLRWLERSAGESPEDAIAELTALSALEAEALRLCLAQGFPDEVVLGPYGPVHWTVLTTHVFWDAWLHERDMSEPLGLQSRPTPAEECVIALYSLLIASVASLLRQHSFDVTIALTSGPRRYTADVAPGRVAVRNDEPAGAEDLTGELVAVVDSLAGRGASLDAVLAGDPAVREPLTWLRPFLVPREGPAH